MGFQTCALFNTPCVTAFLVNRCMYVAMRLSLIISITTVQLTGCDRLMNLKFATFFIVKRKECG